MESLTPEVAPFGIRTMLVEPGFFRADLLEDTSTTWPQACIDDYAERTRQTVAAWHGMNGKQGGDPAKLAKALVQLAGQDQPPRRWVASADACSRVYYFILAVKERFCLHGQHSVMVCASALRPERERREKAALPRHW